MGLLRMHVAGGYVYRAYEWPGLPYLFLLPGYPRAARHMYEFVCI